jgi:hypothetical protein
MTCDDCKALLGQHTGIGPHQSLRTRDAHLADQGEVETYRCGKCGTRWHRFKPDLTFRGPLQNWRVLPNSVRKYPGISPHPRA